MEDSAFLWRRQTGTGAIWSAWRRSSVQRPPSATSITVAAASSRPKSIPDVKQRTKALDASTVKMLYCLLPLARVDGLVESFQTRTQRSETLKRHVPAVTRRRDEGEGGRTLLSNGNLEAWKAAIRARIQAHPQPTLSRQACQKPASLCCKGGLPAVLENHDLTRRRY